MLLLPMDFLLHLLGENLSQNRIMKIGVLGTSKVGNTLGTKLVELGHEVKMGSRTANNEDAIAWSQKNGSKASHGTFSDAALFGESMIFNCTPGRFRWKLSNLRGNRTYTIKY